MGMISMFDQRLLKGWWPLFKMVDGERVLAVSTSLDRW